MSTFEHFLLCSGRSLISMLEYIRMYPNAKLFLSVVLKTLPNNDFYAYPSASHVCMFHLHKRVQTWAQVLEIFQFMP